VVWSLVLQSVKFIGVMTGSPLFRVKV